MSQDSDLQRDVTALGGVVTLSGHVARFPEKHAAAAAAWRVRGVRAVGEQIAVVRLALDAGRDDAEIAPAALARLAWDVLVPDDSMRVLPTGAVDRFDQKAAPAQDLHRRAGVVGRTDPVMVRGRTDLAELADCITHALHRSWLFDGSTVRVGAAGGDIRLTGTVRSLRERAVAWQTAWAADGTTSVGNDLTIL